LIPYGRQNITDEDIAAVVECLRSDFLTQGPKIQAFEEAFAKCVGAKHAVAVNNATAALHLAMLVGGIGPGHRVVTSPITFLASANCAAFVGATPDFSDVDPATLNLCPDTLEKFWKPDTKAVIAVDYAGLPAEMPKISRIAKEKGALVIEDACHGVGGGFEHQGRTWKLGSHPWADMTTFSFHPVKTMTTGEGGMLVTNNDEYAKKARLLRSHGVEREKFSGLGCEEEEFKEKGPWYYEMQALGFNYRLTDIQSALGLSQLKRLPAMIARRQEIVAKYNQELSGISWLQTPGSENLKNRDLISWHLYTVLIDFKKIGKSRTEVMLELRGKGVGTQVLYIPVHLQPWYQKTFAYRPGKCPVAEGVYPRLISLPLYPDLSDADVNHVIESVKAIPKKMLP
jgi:UDP-4-amino-4,6-dideoxy-N-acetyl-beta-L-altrosamine transaminase